MPRTRRTPNPAPEAPPTDESAESLGRRLQPPPVPEVGGTRREVFASSAERRRYLAGWALVVGFVAGYVVGLPPTEGVTGTYDVPGAGQLVTYGGGGSRFLPGSWEPAEDEPGFDCRVHGNGVCGPGSGHNAGCYVDGELVVTWREDMYGEGRKGCIKS